jgi:1,4-alpha-glucan branching enzyme
MSASHFSLLTDDDLYLFNEGSHSRLYRKLGSHPAEVDGKQGTYFAVWAPNAEGVSVIGDFNAWEGGKQRLTEKGSTGIWEGFLPGIAPGTMYKYLVRSRYGGSGVEKIDPLAFYFEIPPRTASIVWDPAYAWNDGEWMRARAETALHKQPVAIYEIHLGSWRRVLDEGNRMLSYRELAGLLPDYIEEMGFTHVEFLPITEHPFYGSWGYQTTGYFAPTSRYGSPQDFKFLVDSLHRRGIGVILDWVPSHFPVDEHALGSYDGTHLYEHSDPSQGFHPDWKSYIFNYGRREVRSFLLSSAMFWLEEYHIDGLRVDAVASMLYLDYSRKKGEWKPNIYGGNENLDAISLLRTFNEDVYRSFPGVQTVAEESTAWPMVSKPTYLGGLGFGFKWDMGWMHDMLMYITREPVHRRFHQNDLTFRLLYAFTENFVLPLSHDEVVHGKSSLLSKMPGDDWQKFANLRLLLGYMYAMSGKKLLFMGGEFGQRGEWNHEESLEWNLLAYAPHQGLQRWVRDLNALYRREPALYKLDCDPAGFEWVDAGDAESSVISWIRKAPGDESPVLIVCNFTPVPRMGYRLGVPHSGMWRELLNSDATEYGGSGEGNAGGFDAEPAPAHGRPFSLNLTLPPLGICFFKNENLPPANTSPHFPSKDEDVDLMGRENGETIGGP